MSDEMMSELDARRRDRYGDQLYIKLFDESEKVAVIVICQDCGSTIADGLRATHDKFHDAYKPSRKATFAIVHDDESIEIQTIDGSVMKLAKEDLIDMEKAREILYQMNEQLAPFYEGGDTALIGVSDDE
jgi:hypothetical protein